MTRSRPLTFRAPILGTVLALVLFLDAGEPAVHAAAASPDSVAAHLSLPVPLGLMHPVFPEGRPPRPPEVALGAALFSDPLLSRDGQVSCATCHDPGKAFADGKSLSLGVGGPTRRNTPTVLNAAFFDRLSWDGRHRSLEEQALEAMTNPREMGLDAGSVAPRVAPSYGPALLEVYGEVSASAVARALGAFQRSLITGDSAFDRYMFGGDADALSPAAKRGFKVFLRHGRCIQCHTARCEECHPFGGRTAFFTNNRFHNLGVGLGPDAPEDGNVDLGRAEVTGLAEDRGAFKTPSLRNVALTAPYMHDGSLATLAEVVDFYDRGGNPNPNLDPEIKPLHLSEREKADLVAFLESLTSSSPVDSPRTEAHLRFPLEPLYTEHAAHPHLISDRYDPGYLDEIELARGTDGRYTLRLLRAGSAVHVVEGVELVRFLPRLPPASLGAVLPEAAAVAALEFHRLETRFWDRSGAAVVGLANNCLAAGLWEVRVSRYVPPGIELEIYHGSFEIPWERYRELLDRETGLDAERFRDALRQPPALRPGVVGLEGLRRVVSSRRLPPSRIEEHLDQPLVELVEQVRKRALVTGQPATYRELYESPGRLELAEFEEPGRYSSSHRRRFDFSLLGRIEEAAVHRVVSPSAAGRRLELSLRTAAGTTLLAGGLDPQVILQRSQRGEAIRLGFGLEVRTASAWSHQRIEDDRELAGTYALVLAADDQLLTPQIAGLEELWIVPGRNDPSVLELFVFGYERELVVAHWTLRTREPAIYRRSRVQSWGLAGWLGAAPASSEGAIGREPPALPIF